MTFKGIVIRTTGSMYFVLTEDGKSYECKLKGSFKIKGIRTTNPIAVGDNVEFILTERKQIGLINKILDRNNYVIRKATKLSSRSHIIAANIDQAFVVVTMIYPRLALRFLDRFLVTCEAYHIPAFIVFNKTDIYDEEINKKLDAIINVYESVGYQCVRVSAYLSKGIEKLKGILQGKINLFSGQSGVGKSTLINTIQAGLDLKTGDISEYNKKGKHITTFAQMFPLDFGGYIIDTPGLKEFGLIDFDKTEIWERFPEMRVLIHNCKFNNCQHISEPDCAVLEALRKCEIHASRYNSYLDIINNDSW